jgi:membrane protein required for colicin V production
MSGLHLTVFDFAAVAIVLLSSIMAFARGLLREVFSIVAFLVAAWLVVLEANHRLIAPLVEGVVQPKLLADGITWAAVFLLVFALVTVLTSSLAKAIHRSGEIGALDRGAGLVFGAARGVLVLALFVLLMRHITGAPQAPMPDWLSQARTYPVLESAAKALEAFVPEARDIIKEKQKSESGAPPDEK